MENIFTLDYSFLLQALNFLFDSRKFCPCQRPLSNILDSGPDDPVFNPQLANILFNVILPHIGGSFL